MPYYNRDPKRDHNFDNHPNGGLGFKGLFRAEGFKVCLGCGVLRVCLGFRGLRSV